MWKLQSTLQHETQNVDAHSRTTQKTKKVVSNMNSQKKEKKKEKKTKKRKKKGNIKTGGESMCS